MINTCWDHLQSNFRKHQEHWSHWCGNLDCDGKKKQHGLWNLRPVYKCSFHHWVVGCLHSLICKRQDFPNWFVKNTQWGNRCEVPVGSCSVMRAIINCNIFGLRNDPHLTFMWYLILNSGSPTYFYSLSLSQRTKRRQLGIAVICYNGYIPTTLLFYLLPSCLLSSPTLWGLISCLRTHSSPLVQGEPCPLEPAPEAVRPWETISACPAPGAISSLKPHSLPSSLCPLGLLNPINLARWSCLPGAILGWGPHLLHVVSLHHSVWLLLIDFTWTYRWHSRRVIRVLQVVLSLGHNIQSGTLSVFSPCVKKQLGSAGSVQVRHALVFTDMYWPECYSTVAVFTSLALCLHPFSSLTLIVSLSWCFPFCNWRL